MTRQYQDILSSVKIEIRPEDKKAADQYYGIAMVLKAVDLIVMAVVVAALCIGLGRDMLLGARMLQGCVWMIFFLCLFYIMLKKIFFRKIRTYLLTDCEPEHLLSCIMALIAHSNRKKGRNWGLHFYNVCSCLYYAGRFEDACKILSLFPKYCPEKDDRFKYELLCARLAYHEKDERALHMHCNYLNGWAGRIGRRNLFYEIYQETIQYPILLRMEKGGAWQQAYGMLYQADAVAERSGRRSMLSKVKANFQLYRMAKGMGDERRAVYHGELSGRTEGRFGMGGKWNE